MPVEDILYAPNNIKDLTVDTPPPSADFHIPENIKKDLEKVLWPNDIVELTEKILDQMYVNLDDKFKKSLMAILKNFAPSGSLGKIFLADTTIIPQTGSNFPVTFFPGKTLGTLVEVAHAQNRYLTYRELREIQDKFEEASIKGLAMTGFDTPELAVIGERPKILSWFEELYHYKESTFPFVGEMKARVKPTKSTSLPTARAF